MLLLCSEWLRWASRLFPDGPRAGEALHDLDQLEEKLGARTTRAFDALEKRIDGIATKEDVGRILQAVADVDLHLSTTASMWREDFDQKLFAAIRMIRLVWPQMKERRFGRIINVLNIGAKAPRAGGAPTAVTRAAGMALTKVLAGEGAPHNVLVNALLIGLIEADQHVQRAKRLGKPLAPLKRPAHGVRVRPIGREHSGK